MPCFGYNTLLSQSLLSTHIMEGKLKIMKTHQKSEEIVYIYLIFFAFGDFYYDVIKNKRHVWLGCTETRSP